MTWSSVSGATSSRLVPVTPWAPAASSVWQLQQAWRKKSRPALNLSLASCEESEPDPPLPASPSASTSAGTAMPSAM
jgi:hypothetical protein